MKSNKNHLLIILIMIFCSFSIKAKSQSLEADLKKISEKYQALYEQERIENAKKFQFDMNTKEAENIYNISTLVKSLNHDMAIPLIATLSQSKNLTAADSKYLEKTKAYLDTICPKIDGQIYTLIYIDSLSKTFVIRKNKKFGFYQDQDYNLIQGNNKYWSFRNYAAKGKFIAQCIFDEFYGVQKNKNYGTVLHVGKDGKQGLMRLDGTFFIPMKYSAINFNYNGTDNAYFYNSDAFIGAKLYDKFCIINLEGKQITEAKYDHSDVDYYKSRFNNNNQLQFKNGTGKFIANGTTETIDNYGKNLKPIYYDAILDYGSQYSRGIKNGYFTLLKNENPISATNYTYIDAFVKGLAKVYKNNLVGLINTDGKEVLPVEYDFVGPFFNGQAKIKKQGKWGLIDDSFNIILKPIGTWVDYFQGNYARLGVNGIILFINRKQEYNEKLSFAYADLFIDGIARVGKGINLGTNDGLVYTRYGFIDVNGTPIIPLIYKTIGDFYEGLVWASNSSDKFGFVNKKNETVIPFIYEDAFAFVNGLAVVKKNGMYGMINTKNEVIIPFIYDKLRPFYNDRAAAFKDKWWQFIDRQNKAIGPKTQGELIDYSNHKAIVINDIERAGFSEAEKNDNAYYKIDTNGNLIKGS